MTAVILMMIALFSVALELRGFIRATTLGGRVVRAFVGAASLGIAIFWGMVIYDTHLGECGDDCLRPGEEMWCSIDVITGEMVCAKGTPPPIATPRGRGVEA